MLLQTISVYKRSDMSGYVVTDIGNTDCIKSIL